MEWEWEGVYDGVVGDWRGRAVVLKDEAEARILERDKRHSKIIVDYEARLGEAKARATAFFDEGIKRADKIRDLESRLAAAERDGKEAVDELAGENTEHMNRIAALEIKLADANAIAESRSEALDEQDKRHRKKLEAAVKMWKYCFYNCPRTAICGFDGDDRTKCEYRPKKKPSGDGKGGMVVPRVKGTEALGNGPTQPLPAPETPEGKHSDCDDCIKENCSQRNYHGILVCRPLRK